MDKLWFIHARDHTSEKKKKKYCWYKQLNDWCGGISQECQPKSKVNKEHTIWFHWYKDVGKSDLTYGDKFRTVIISTRGLTKIGDGEVWGWGIV